MRNTVSLVLPALILAASLAIADQTHPFSVHDMLAMDRISDPQVSPDGTRVAFVVRETDLQADCGRNDLWLVGTAGAGLRRLTSHPQSDTNPRWDPDGRTIWFLSDRSGSSQVWRIGIDGGEARQVTREPLDVGNLQVAPDGRHIAYTMEVFPDCSTAQATKGRLDAKPKNKATGQIYERLFVRHWDAWEDGRRSHLFVRPIAADGNSVDVMRGMDADTPSQPFGGPEEITFTPDGQEVVFSAKDVGGSEPWSTDFDLYAAPVDGSASLRCLTADNDAWDTQPVFSPDGRTLAYLAMSRPGYEADRFRIMLRDWPSGSTHVLTEAWDRSPSAIHWSSDGRSIHAVAPNVGQDSVFSIGVVGGTARMVVNEGVVQAFDVGSCGIVYCLSHMRAPAELYSVQPDGSGVKKLTDINAEKVKAARMGDYEQFSFPGWNDETVYGYVVKPADFEPGHRYPVAFLIHGGPQGSWNNIFHYRWNPQAYAGAGYAVVMVDFHGSTGYGQAFCDAIRGDWGGKPLVDIQKGLTAALERYPWMDGDRVGALGASFGGYMINWIAGQWPDRFRCLVNHDGTLDERMAYFDTEELWFPEWEYTGTPWDKPDAYEHQNPVRFVQNWKTPMLIIHGGQDFRVSATHGLGAFNALQRRGIPSKLLYFPDENHWVLKPHNSILWHQTVIAWLDQWLKPAGHPDKPDLQ